MPDPPSPITLPIFTDEVRAQVPGDDTFDDFEPELQTWIERFTKARAATRYEPLPSVRRETLTSPYSPPGSARWPAAAG